MQFVPYRNLRNQPEKFRQTLAKEGQLIITNNGEPFALMVNIKPDEVENTLYLMAQIRAQRALSELRAQAKEQSLDQLTAEEIQAEIDSVRQAQ